MLRLISNWIASALSLMVVAAFVSGFEVSGFAAAMLASVVIGLVNATLGLFLRVITLPITLATFGIFWFVLNAILLRIAAALVPGFNIRGFLPAFLGAIVLSIVNLLFKLLAKGMAEKPRD